MNDKFDELARDLAQSVTRRAALKKFGVGFVEFRLDLEVRIHFALGWRRPDGHLADRGRRSRCPPVHRAARRADQGSRASRRTRVLRPHLQRAARTEELP